MTPQKPKESMEWEKEFVEKGADLEHERWSKWQKWMHSKLVEADVMDGHLTHRKVGTRRFLPEPLFERWERQIATPYSELSEQEKESDREQVRPYLPLVRQAISTALAHRDKELREKVEKKAFRGFAPYEHEYLVFKSDVLSLLNKQ